MPSKSKQQQKFMGMVHSLQKGDMKPSDASAELKRAAKSLGKKDAKDYASTSHKGLPRKVKQEIARKLREYANKMGTNTMGGDSIPSAKKGGLRDFDGYDNVDYNKDMPMDEASSADAYKISRMLGTAQQSTQDFIDDNKIDVKKLELYIKKLSPSKKIIIKDIVNGSIDKRLSTIKKGLIKQVKESLDESHYTAIANLGTKKAKENLDSFDELQKFMDKMKSRKAISVQVTKINGGKKQTINYDWDGRNWVSKNKKGVQENFPSNWLQGRVSDYHTKKGTTPRDAYDKTNFNTKHSGQEDLEDGELEESGKDKSEKNYKAWKSSRIKKEIVRKLREWGSNLDNSYILDKDSILKGTPEDKDAIKREDIVDQSFNKAKVVDEAVDKSDLKNAKNRLKDPHTIEDIEYSKTRSGDKFVKIIYKKKYVAGKMMDTGPHFVSVFYNDEKDLQNIGKALKLKLKESVSEVAKRDYKAEYKKFQSSTKSKKYRAELNKYNRQRGTYGNGDGKDASHKGGKIVGFETESKNRGRREKSRLKKK